MSYRVRYTMSDGRTGRWTRDYATRDEAQRAIGSRVYDTGFAYFVEEVPDVSTAAVPDASPDPTASQWPGQPAPEKPTSTTERLVGLIRDRHALGLSKYGTTLDRGDLTPEQWAQHAIEEAVDLAGYLMRLKDGCGQEPGSTAAHHVEVLRGRIKELEAGLAKAKASLAKAPSVPVGALEAPREGGDSDRRRLEAIERFLDGDTFRQIWKTTQGNIVAGTTIEGQEYAAPTLAALADKLMEMEAKP